MEIPDAESLTQSGIIRFVEELAQAPAGTRPPPKGVVAQLDDKGGEAANMEFVLLWCFCFLFHLVFFWCFFVFFRCWC